MMKFPIPILDKESWCKLEDYLDLLSNKLNIIESKVQCKEVFECNILLGLIDMTLGRTIELDEAINDIKTSISESSDYWVVSSDYKVLLSDPPKYQGIIKHYHNENNIKYEDVKKCCKEQDKIFTTKDEAIQYLKNMNFYNWEIIDVDLNKVSNIILNNEDYE